MVPGRREGDHGGDDGDEDDGEDDHGDKKDPSDEGDHEYLGVYIAGSVTGVTD